MAFNLTDMENWPRREHYAYYTGQLKTSYQISINVDITALKAAVAAGGYRFYPVMLYVIMKAINRNEAFRMAVNKEGKLGFYDICHPSYTIFHEDDHTFSDIWSYYNEDFPAFYKQVVEDMETYKDVKGVKIKPGHPDAFCPISCVPWLSFTGVGHDTGGPSEHMLFPVITYGRYFKQNGRWLLPFALFINHAAADGYHTSMLIQDIQQICDTFLEN